MSPGIPTRLLATQSDDRLLALVRQGHERAFEALVHRYRKPLLGYCRRMRLTDSRAEDIVQLALLKTWIAVREGAEVRDLKPWLYRVVHNTAVNAMRDSAHDGDPLGDPLDELASSTLATNRLGSNSASFCSDDAQLDRGLQMREALAEVAALPPLQREVIVRTAVAGHSHEQVASDLGITNGAVRGLLYRARTTLRTAMTALTPAPLLTWLAGRANQGGAGPERITELAAGAGGGVGGAAGISGLLLKGGAVALTAGTMITGAVVHLSTSPHHHHHSVAVASSRHGASSPRGEHILSGDPELASTVAASPHGRLVRGRRAPAAGGRSHGAHTRGGSAGSHLTPSARLAPDATRPSHGGRQDAPSAAPTSPDLAPGSNQGATSTSGPGTSTASAPTTGASEPAGSSAGSGTGSAPEGTGEQTDDSAGSEGETGNGQSTTDSPGAGSETAGSQGSSSESGNSQDTGEHTSLVGAVVHEVGSVLEHLLH